MLIFNMLTSAMIAMGTNEDKDLGSDERSDLGIWESGIQV